MFWRISHNTGLLRAVQLLSKSADAFFARLSPTLFPGLDPSRLCPTSPGGRASSAGPPSCCASATAAPRRRICAACARSRTPEPDPRRLQRIPSSGRSRPPWSGPTPPQACVASSSAPSSCRLVSSSSSPSLGFLRREKCIALARVCCSRWRKKASI